MKKTVKLENMDPVEIYGVGNRVLEALCGWFPQLRVVARGDEIILEGSENDCERFEEKIRQLIDRRLHKRNLTPYDVEDLFDGEKMPDRFIPLGDSVIVHGLDGKPIRARNKTQEEMVRAYFENDLIFAVGPAGTGKTYIAIALAVRALKHREIKRIILTRPAVEAGERLGFLPGDLKDKLDPYLQPLYDALRDMIPAKRLDDFMAEGIVQIAPLAYMRMFLTRMGCDAKFIVTGDASQIDLPDRKESGLMRGINLVKDIKGVSCIFFRPEDIVRHPLVSKIVKAFETAEK